MKTKATNKLILKNGKNKFIACRSTIKYDLRI